MAQDPHLEDAPVVLFLVLLFILVSVCADCPLALARQFQACLCLSVGICLPEWRSPILATLSNQEPPLYVLLSLVHVDPGCASLSSIRLGAPLNHMSPVPDSPECLAQDPEVQEGCDQGHPPCQ